MFGNIVQGTLVLERQHPERYALRQNRCFVSRLRDVSIEASGLIYLSDAIEQKKNEEREREVCLSATLSVLFCQLSRKAEGA